MSVLEGHSHPPRDHEIRRPQKATHVESSSNTHYSSSSISSRSRFEEDNFRNFCMKIDLPCFNENRSLSDYVKEFYHLSSRIYLIESESYMISRFKGGLRWKIEDKVALQSFFKFNDIIMAVERVEALLEKGKTRIQNFGS
ncbi:unnamed protein product [Spirodela intermedia]|uniref:Uncharacterized protein n=1 Tax=Spirodela intermedia TaxID=51605 RepID=A0A7I8L6Z0_SPIIN|nr:unnamed protein product [Spirodela intermedia]